MLVVQVSGLLVERKKDDDDPRSPRSGGVLRKTYGSHDPLRVPTRPSPRVVSRDTVESDYNHNLLANHIWFGGSVEEGVVKEYFRWFLRVPFNFQYIGFGLNCGGRVPTPVKWRCRLKVCKRLGTAVLLRI